LLLVHASQRFSEAPKDVQFHPEERTWTVYSETSKHLPQTVTSQTLSASIAFKSCLLLPLLLVHASQLKQRDLDRNCKEFLRLQKMFNFIAGLMTIP
ncbi:hypothetical protein T4B_15103, partial [Trichinella pseudospiralis]